MQMPIVDECNVISTQLKSKFQMMLEKQLQLL
jgi:hypothetical protein